MQLSLSGVVVFIQQIIQLQSQNAKYESLSSKYAGRYRTLASSQEMDGQGPRVVEGTTDAQLLNRQLIDLIVPHMAQWNMLFRMYYPRYVIKQILPNQKHTTAA